LPRLKLNDISMFYRTSGRGKPLLAIHGLGGDNTSWEYVEPYLSKRRKLIMPDLRCHGKSGSTGGIVAPSDYANDLATLIQHLGYDSLPVLGTSLGGLVLQQLVLEDPESVSAAVMIDTAPKITEYTGNVVYSWREAQVNSGDEAYWWASTQDGLTPEFIDKHPEVIRHLKEKFLRASGLDMVNAVLGFADFDAVDRLRRVKVPVLVVHGGRDRVFLPEMGQLLHDSIKNSQFRIIEGVGHSPDIEVPELLSDVLLQFLNEQGV